MEFSNFTGITMTLLIAGNPSDRTFFHLYLHGDHHGPPFNSGVRVKSYKLGIEKYTSYQILVMLHETVQAIDLGATCSCRAMVGGGLRAMRGYLEPTAACC